MTDDNLKENLEALIPQGLDDIIRKNRKYCQVRKATESDIKPLLGEVQEAQPKLVITNWHLVTIELMKENGLNKGILLLGDILDVFGNTWITSGVVRLDLASGYLLTHSGSRYMLHEKGDGEPSLAQLALLCKRMHKYGSGEVFGVPEFF